MDIILKPKQITKFFAYIVACLTLAHVAGECFAYTLENKSTFEPFFHLIDFKDECNIPTLYSSLALLFCSSLLVLITFAKKKNGERYYYWLGLAVIFLFLSIDETFIIHERLTNRVHTALDTSGFLYFAWIIPYSIASIIFLLVYIKFIFKLPGRTRLLFITAGLIFLSGAVGVESIEGRYVELYSRDSINYVISNTISEFLEMTGIVVFIYALTSYIDSELKDLQLSIKS